MKFKEISCPICERNFTKKLFKTEDFRLNTVSQKFNLVQCKKCGFIYINPQPVEKELSKFYPQGYYNPTPFILEFFYKPIGKAIIGRIISDIKSIKKRGRLLDIGCGKGSFLVKLLKCGYDAYGVDSYDGILNIIPKELQSRVKNSSFLNIKFPDEFFDIIVMKQVLEHLPKSNMVIREIHRILKKDGLVYVEVPNFNCMESKLFGKYWYNLEIPRHLYQFSKKTLKKIFKKNDFRFFLELNNYGFLLLKSPLAIVNSCTFFLRDKIKSSLLENLMKMIYFLPLIIITPFFRFFSNREGMDIRMIFIKNK
jgi:2-polyprenyl-3-methyl-5-hydroxy-6-metoxy-1,4-benzoquinol methylase